MVRYSDGFFIIDIESNIQMNKLLVMDLTADLDYSDLLVNQTIKFKPTKNRAKYLFDNGFNFDSTATRFLPKLSLINDNSFQKLFPFQKEGVQKMLEMKTNVILADEMGCGKTPQASVFLKLKENSLPAIIICPASLKFNWRREIKKWCGVESYVISGKKVESLEKISINYPVCIINYDILGYEDEEEKQLEKNKKKISEESGKKYRKTLPTINGWVKELSKYNFNTIICDECQRLGDLNTIRTRAVLQLANTFPSAKKIMISGTPYETRVLQLFPILKIVAPNEFDNEWKFKFRYCSPIRSRFGWQFRGLSNGLELHNRLSKFMIRRLKKDVLKDLPPKIRSIIPLEISESNLVKYRKKELELDDYIINKNKNALAKLSELKQLAFDVKKESALNYIKDYLDSGKKLIVFIWHHEAYNFLINEFKDVAVSICGDTTAKAKDKAEFEFQNNKDVKLLICNIESAGVGLTLTASDTVVFLEFGKTAPSMVQAEDRVNRIGQQSECTYAQYLIFENSIDSDMMEVFNDRFAKLTEVIDGKLDEKMFKTDEDIDLEIIKMYSLRKGLTKERRNAINK